MCAAVGVAITLGVVAAQAVSASPVPARPDATRAPQPIARWRLPQLASRVGTAALSPSGQARAGAPPDSRPAQARWRSLLAAIHAARGQAGDAVALATHAHRLLHPTDLLPLRADVLTDLSSALAARGDTAKARRAARHALALYTEKGNIVAGQRARNTCLALSART